MRRILNMIDDDGKTVATKELPNNAAIVTPATIASFVGDEGGMPMTGELLVSVIYAATKRLEDRIRFLEG